MNHPMRTFTKTITGAATAALAAIALLSVAPTLALAETETYRIDPGHTNIGFKVRHFFSKVPGRFNEFEGQIVLDRENLTEGSSVEFTIDIASIDTNNPSRDKHLRSDAFFDVENHPKMTFKSRKVTSAGENKLKVEGDLTIRGITKPVSLEVDVLGFGKGYGFRGGFEVRTTIDRQEFNVSWNDLVEGAGVLGDEVEILMNIEAVRLKKTSEVTP
ncbi:MAG: YceI family protein [Acidobacteria bacterium]|nr:YceI family protein [Acidobacteriota bacterium]